MSIWKEIGKALNSTIKTGDCIPLDKLLGDKIDAFQNSAKSGGVPIVRRIQRGTVSIGTTGGSWTATVSLSGFSNINKMIVLINGNAVVAQTTSSYGSSDAYVSSLSVSSVTFRSAIEAYATCTFSYQVIEFY